MKKSSMQRSTDANLMNRRWQFWARVNCFARHCAGRKENTLKVNVFFLWHQPPSQIRDCQPTPPLRSAESRPTQGLEGRLAVFWTPSREHKTDAPSPPPSYARSGATLEAKLAFVRLRLRPPPPPYNPLEGAGGASFTFSLTLLLLAPPPRYRPPGPRPRRAPLPLGTLRRYLGGGVGFVRLRLRSLLDADLVLDVGARVHLAHLQGEVCVCVKYPVCVHVGID